MEGKYGECSISTVGKSCICGFEMYWNIDEVSNDTQIQV